MYPKSSMKKISVIIAVSGLLIGGLVAYMVGRYNSNKPATSYTSVPSVAQDTKNDNSGDEPITGSIVSQTAQ
jgi:hypothetical protein